MWDENSENGWKLLLLSIVPPSPSLLCIRIRHIQLFISTYCLSVCVRARVDCAHSVGCAVGSVFHSACATLISSSFSSLLFVPFERNGIRTQYNAIRIFTCTFSVACQRSAQCPATIIAVLGIAMTIYILMYFIQPPTHPHPLNRTHDERTQREYFFSWIVNANNAAEWNEICFILWQNTLHVSTGPYGSKK